MGLDTEGLKSGKMKPKLRESGVVFLG